MTDAPSEEELVTIEKYVDDLAADMLRSQVVALVAALRSARDDTRIANERGDAWREQVKEDTLTIEKLREKNDRQAYRLSQYQAEVETTRHNLTGCVAELERERTQNLRLSAALRDLLDSDEADYYESADAARAALSTQEESK